MEMGDAVGARDAEVSESVDESGKPALTAPSPATSGASSPSYGGSDSPANRNSQELIAKEEEESRDKTVTLERRDSYRLATKQHSLVSADPSINAAAKSTVGEQKPKKDVVTNFKGKVVDTIKRSTSSVEASSQAAIKLRTNLNMSKSPRAVSSVSGVFSPPSLDRVSTFPSGKDSAISSLKSYMSPRSILDHLIDKEINTGTYMAPLIGCIPPSALKCFADKKELFQSPMTSPSHSQSGKGSGSKGPIWY